MVAIYHYTVGYSRAGDRNLLLFLVKGNVGGFQQPAEPTQPGATKENGENYAAELCHC